MKTTESNKMIAEFMGWRYYENATPSFVHPDIPHKYNIEGLLYGTSWDWLMPVVEKIERTFETKTSLPLFKIDSHHARFYHTAEAQWIAGCFKSSVPERVWFNTKIQAVYYVAVEFIKWYNKNSQS